MSDQCLAQEWQRDGRGLWAMRSCQRESGHGQQHVFSQWRYNVTPPTSDLDGPAGGARGDADARARDAGTPQSTGTSCPCGYGSEAWHWPRGGVCIVGEHMPMRTQS